MLQLHELRALQVQGWISMTMQELRCDMSFTVRRSLSCGEVMYALLSHKTAA